MSWPTISIREIMVKRGGSVNPSKFPDEAFDLLSIPAFDKGEIEVLPGSEIGSSKSCIEPGDVLLSKIIPHIRRCWVVPQKNNRRQIGSGEWIIFRSNKFDSNYLKHYLTSDGFHQKFMSTVAGVGGSLVRARPAQLEGYEIPIPPLEEQKRIAAILDKADAMRRKRQQAIELSEQFLKSMFLEMFGDPVTNPKGWDTQTLGELVEIKSGATPSKSKPEFWCGDYPWVSPKDMKTVVIDDSIDHVSESVFVETSQKRIPDSSILIVVRGMILAHTVPICITNRELAINQDIKAFSCSDKILPIYFLWLLKSQHENLLSKVSTAAHGTKRLDMEVLTSLRVMLPDIDIQEEFVKITEAFESLHDTTIMSHNQILELSLSISQQVFADQVQG